MLRSANTTDRKGPGKEKKKKSSLNHKQALKITIHSKCVFKYHEMKAPLAAGVCATDKHGAGLVCHAHVL